MPPDKPKLLIHSNAPWSPTGYGIQIGLFAPLLNETYEVSVSAFYGLEGNSLNWNGIQVLPGLGGEFGNQYLLQHATNVFGGSPRGGLMMSLMDVWVLDPAIVSQMNACSWVPVDHDPAPPAVLEFFRKSHSVPIAMSRFGQERLEEFDPLYVPHGVDVDVYKPHDQATVRESFGWDKEAFVVGMVAANKGRPSRKGFQQAFEAFAVFRQTHENAMLYLHTSMNADWSQGEDLASLLSFLEIPEESIKIANQYRTHFAPAPGPTMAQLYSGCDVLLNPAMGEGFGIPILEAQACGTPAIVTDFSAMKEVCGAGWKVGHIPYWTGQKSRQAIPDVPGIVGALEECYGLSDADRKKLSAKARRHAMKYAAPKVLQEHFLPALAEVEERYKPKPPSVPAKVVSG